MLPITSINISHHEVLYNLMIMPHKSNVIEFENNYRKWTITTNGSPLPRESILMYFILYDHYIKYKDDEGYAYIRHYDIEKAYRKKGNSLLYITGEPKEYFKNRLLAISQLKNFQLSIISLAKNEHLMNERAKTQSLIKLDTVTKYGMRYSLGEFGKLLINSGRTSTLLPTSLISISLNKLNQLLYGTYISRYIFINRRKTKSGRLNLGTLTIMKSIRYYSKGIPTDHSLYDEISKADVKRRWQLLNQFALYLEQTMNCFVSENKIKGFYLPNLKLQYFVDPESMLTILL